MCSVIFPCFIIQEINKPHRGFLSLYCYVSEIYDTYGLTKCQVDLPRPSLLVWKRFLSAVIGVFPLLCDTTVMPEGEIRAEVTIAVCRDLASCSRTLEEDTCSLLLRFEWSFRVKWENTWWLMCWVSFMTLEFLKEVETSLLSQRYMSAGEKISMTEQFFFFFLLLSMNNDTPQSHISLSLCTSNLGSNIQFRAGCDMIDF